MTAVDDRPTIKRRATTGSVPVAHPPAASDSLDGHGSRDALVGPAAEGTTSDLGPMSPDALCRRAEVGTDSPSGAVRSSSPIAEPRHSGPILNDPTLLMAAQVVDDLERTRIANENRLRQMTRSVEDSDGNERGLGLDENHPDVARLAGIVAAMGDLEHQAVLGLQRAMRRHPLGPWVKAQKGVGEKQAARLLAAIGDPYWNTLHDRPRTVSELWAYSGLHVTPGQTGIDDHRTAAGDQTTSGGALAPGETQVRPGVAARRRKGQKANWNTDAKTRAYLVAVSCMKVPGAPYREAYLDRRAHTLLTHPEWTDGHSHNDALRVTSKAILRDLWIAARDIHEETT